VAEPNLSRGPNRSFNIFVRAYLRASTDEQDASRARAQLKHFVAERGLKIVAYYAENESGAKLARPELFRLLNDAEPGDILLVEQVDRLSRLTATDWERLKAELTSRRVRVVALDLPTSWMMATKSADEFTGRMFEAINGMLLDMLAAVARKDYDDRPAVVRERRPAAAPSAALAPAVAVPAIAPAAEAPTAVARPVPPATTGKRDAAAAAAAADFLRWRDVLPAGFWRGSAAGHRTPHEGAIAQNERSACAGIQSTVGYQQRGLT
jgi:hypothetical protein